MLFFTDTVYWFQILQVEKTCSLEADSFPLLRYKMKTIYRIIMANW